MKAMQRGFTLIELMIVIAIIGILAAIAIPNFNRFQAKSKQAESRANLKGIFTAAKARFAERDNYGSSFLDIGFAPERNNRYTYNYGTAVWNGRATTDTGTGGAAETSSGSVVSSVTNAAPFTFVASACGNVDTDTFINGWAINQNNIIGNNLVTAAAVVNPTTELANDVVLP